MRRIMAAAVVVAAVLVGGAPTAYGEAPVNLALSQSTAFSILGYSCGGIQEQQYATGFASPAGYPAGYVYLQTVCGGSGRGGRSTTHSVWVSATWDFTGSTVSTSALSAAPTGIDPVLSVFDQFGNQLYNASGAAYLLLASGFTPAPRITGVSPSSGSAAGGTVVTITGTGFTGATSVAFETVPAVSFVVLGDSTVTAVSPPAAGHTPAVCGSPADWGGPG